TKSFKQIIVCLCCIAVCIFSGLLVTNKVDASTYSFNKPTIGVGKPVNFLNGSFETDLTGMDASKIILSNYGTVNMPSSTHKSTTWSSYPVSISGNNYGITSFRDSRCWLIESSSNPGTYGLSKAANGSRFAELNAYAAGRLYQDIATVPGTRIYWQFAHAGRQGASTSKPDIMRFSLKAAGNVAVAPTGSEIIQTGKATSTNWTYYRGVYTVPDGQTNTQFGFEAVSSSNGNSAYGNMLDDIKFQTGASLITEKSIYNSSGQRIDGSYGEYSDVITIKVKVTNWGETDATPCVLTDTLWDGLEFVDGSVSGDTGVTGTVSCSNGTVTANIGIGASGSAGGTIKGSQSLGASGTTGKGGQAVVTIHAKIVGSPGLTVKNQAKVTYNDKDFESYNPNGLTSYSCIDYGKDDANDIGNSSITGAFTMNILKADGTLKTSYDGVDINNEETYVNQFTIVDRQVNGKVWTDNNEDGNQTDGERVWANTSVKLQKKADDGTWSDTSDWSDTPLVTTTDADGKYTFKGIVPGTYRVVLVDSTNYKATTLKCSDTLTETQAKTGTQGNPENDAQTLEDGTVVIQEFTTNLEAFTPGSPVYYTYNADIGMVPNTEIKKDAYIGDSTTVNNGTSDTPSNVVLHDTVTYKITVTNNATNDQDTINRTITDILPEGMTYVSSDPEATVENQTVTWNLSELPKGDTTLTVTVKVNEVDKDLLNTASLKGNFGDPINSNTTYHHSYGLNLTISKKVTGQYADMTKSFPFSLNLNDSTGNEKIEGTYSYTGNPEKVGNVTTPTSGTIDASKTIKFSLKDGQSITIKNLPKDTQYIIEELEHANYDVSCTTVDSTTYSGTANTNNFENAKTTGQIFYNDASNTFTNSRTKVVVTNAGLGGVNSDLWPIIIGLGMAAIAISAVLYLALQKVNSKEK
ncbi:MAG: DUF7601 domain-containing protein, partial [Eubacteriaceae bacterium]